MKLLQARNRIGAVTTSALALLVLTACDPPPGVDPNDTSVKVEVQLEFYDPVEQTNKPIVGVQLEIWTYGPVGAIWGWVKDRVAATDVAGHYATELPFRDENVVYAIRVIPDNGALRCCNWVPVGQVLGNWWIEPGQELGEPVHLKASSAAEDVTFTHVFEDEWGSIFNSLDVVRYAADFVRANHQNLDNDDLGVARLGQDSKDWFDPVAYTISLRPSQRWDDWALLHEYGHYVQAQIGTLAWIAASHTGCTPGKFAIFGGGHLATVWYDGKDVPAAERRQHAWLEGFADWLAEVVITSYSGAFDTSTRRPLEGAGCPEAGDWPDGDRFEDNVAAFLWDMTDMGNTGESWDREGGLARVNQILTAVDNGIDSNNYWPTIVDLNFALSGPGLSTFGADNAIANRVTWPIID